MRQVFIGRGKKVTVTDALERKLYIIRKSAGHAIQRSSSRTARSFYVPSMSARTVAQGMLLAHTGRRIYKDLQDARVNRRSRWSPALLDEYIPSLDLAHHSADLPQRRDQHARATSTDPRAPGRSRAPYSAATWQDLAADLRRQSDSASSTTRSSSGHGGYSVAHAMMMMIPRPGEPHADGSGAARVLRVPRAMMEP